MLDSGTFVLTSISFLCLSFLIALSSSFLPTRVMSASLSASTPSAFLPSKRGQLRETLAGVLSSPWVLYALFFSPLGLFGLHHAWLGHWRRFLAYLVTFGLWGVGWLYDLSHLSELAKEQRGQQHKPAGHSTGAVSPCAASAAWALRVEGSTGAAKDKHDDSTAAPRFRPPAPSASSAPSMSTWSPTVPSVAVTQLTHHTALADAFPLPSPPAPSHTHNKHKSELDAAASAAADESATRPVSVKVLSAEIEDTVEKAREANRASRGQEAQLRQRREGADNGGERASRGAHREDEAKQAGQRREEAHDGLHERAIVSQQQGEDSSRQQQLKHAMLNKQHSSVVAADSAHASKPGDGVVYLRTLAPSRTVPAAIEAQSVTFSPSPAVGSTPLKPVEPVAVLRPVAGGGVSEAASNNGHGRASAQAAALDADDEAGGAEGVDEQQQQQRDGGAGNGHGRGGQAGNSGGRRRSGKSKR